MRVGDAVGVRVALAVTDAVGEGVRVSVAAVL